MGEVRADSMPGQSPFFNVVWRPVRFERRPTIRRRRELMVGGRGELAPLYLHSAQPQKGIGTGFKCHVTSNMSDSGRSEALNAGITLPLSWRDRFHPNHITADADGFGSRRVIPPAKHT